MSANEIQNAMSAKQQNNTHHNINIQQQVRVQTCKTELATTVRTALEQQNVAKNCRISIASSSEQQQQRNTHFKNVLSAYTLAHDLAQLKELKPAASAVEKVLNWRWQSVVSPVEDVHVFQHLFEEREANVDKQRFNQLSGNMLGNQSQYNYAQFQKYMQQHHAQPIELKHLRRSSRCISKPFKYEQTVTTTNAMTAKNFAKETTRKRAYPNRAAEPQAKRKLTQATTVSSQKVIKKLITATAKSEIKKSQAEAHAKIIKTTVNGENLLTKKSQAASNLIVLRQDFTTKNLHLGEKRAQLFQVNQIREKPNSLMLQPPPPPPISVLHAQTVKPLQLQIEKNNNTLVKSTTTTNKSSVCESPASSSGFHQQHVFCNYLGLTGMSTATAVANAVAEFANSTTTRRSLRVRNLQQKLKQQSQNTIKQPNINMKPTVGCQMKIVDKKLPQKPNSNNFDGSFSVPRMHRTNSINPDSVPAIRIVHRFSSISQDKEETKTPNIFIPPKLKSLQELLPKRRLITSIKNITMNDSRTQPQVSQRLPAAVKDCTPVPKLSQSKPNNETAKSVTCYNEVSETTNHVGNSATHNPTTSCSTRELSAAEALLSVQIENNGNMIQNLPRKTQEQTKANVLIDAQEQIIENSNLYSNEKIMQKEEKQNSALNEEIAVVNLVEEAVVKAVTPNHLCNAAKVSNIVTKTRVKITEIDKSEHLKQNGRLLLSSTVKEEENHNIEQEKHEDSSSIKTTMLPILKTTTGNKHKLSFTEFENQYAQHVVANGLEEEQYMHNIEEFSKKTVTPIVQHLTNNAIKTAKRNVGKHVNSKLSEQNVLSANSSAAVDCNVATIKSPVNNDANHCVLENAKPAAAIFKLENPIMAQSLSNNSNNNNLAETVEAQENLNGTTHSHYKSVEHKDVDAETIKEVVQEELRSNVSVENVKELNSNTHAEYLQKITNDPCSNDAADIKKNVVLDVVQQKSSNDVGIQVAKLELTNNVAVQVSPIKLSNNVAVQVVQQELSSNVAEKKEISNVVNPCVENVPADEKNHIFAENNLKKSNSIPRANIRYFSKSCVTPQKNPLKEEFGSVLYIYYELDVLIVVQELLISFWKYPKLFNVLKMAAADEVHNSEGEWLPLDQCRRLTNDIEISAAYTNRLCFNNSIPVYVEMRGRHRPPELGRINDLLSLYINIYYYHDEEMQGKIHSIDLDIVQSLPIEVTYTTISESRYFVMCWPQIVLGKRKKTGMCKYSLTPQLDTLASIREFKDLRHHVLLLECASDDKLLGFGETQLTIWDHRSGDVLMNYDFEMTLGRNVGSIYYHRAELDQNNMLLLFQLMNSQIDNQHELVMLLCSVSHVTPTHRVLKRLVMPSPAFSAGVRSADNIGENLVLTAQQTNMELWISCSDPNTMLVLPSQTSQRYYARARTQVIELTEHTLTVDSLSNHLLKLNANLNDAL